MSKCEVIAIANQKGGVGKTTTTFTLGVALAKQNNRVLLVDTDPQCDLTTSMGWHDAKDIPNNMATLIASYINNEKFNINESILHHKEKVDLIPSNLELSSLDVKLNFIANKESVIRGLLSEIKNNYDYVIIDCMPSLGMLTVNALATADKVIIPVESHFLAAKGMNRLLETVLKVRRNINPHLKIGGIVLTMIDNRTNLSKSMTEELKSTYGNLFKLFDTSIPKSVKIAEASRVGESIISYCKNNKGALAYESLAKEVLFDGTKERTKSISSNVQSR